MGIKEPVNRPIECCVNRSPKCLLRILDKGDQGFSFKAEIV